MRVINLSVRRLDNLPVARALQRRVGRVLRRDDVDERMEFVRTVDPAGARHRDRVVVAGPAFGGRQIIPAVAFMEMRPLDEAVRASRENQSRLADEPARRRLPFLQRDAEERRMLEVGAGRVAMVPDHVEDPFAAVVVVEQRGVEAARIHVGSLRPWAFDRRRGNDVVVRILEVSVEPLDVGVDEPELPVGVGKAGRPDAAGIRARRACREGTRDRAGARRAASSRDRASDEFARPETIRRSTWR